MKLLILKKFNNYFNRKIIKYDNLEDYASHSEASLTINSFNFNPNDGVRTDVVLGKGDKGLDAFFDFETTKSADYLVAYSTETIHNGDEPDVDVNTIESRWFITEVKRTRGGQYAIQLKRDSIADNLSTLINCPAFIRKGTLDDNNPLILNNEGVSVNQIKTENEFLKDGSGSSWIVGYMPKNTGISGHQITASVSGETDLPYTTIEDLASELDVDAGELGNVLTTSQSNESVFINGNIEIIGPTHYGNSRSAEINITGSQDYLSTVSYTSYQNSNNYDPNNCFADRRFYLSTGRQAMLNIWKNAVAASLSQIKANWQSLTNATFLPIRVFNKLNELNGTYLRKGGLYYKINVGSSSTGFLRHIISNNAVPFNTICNKAIQDWNAYVDEVGPSEFSPASDFYLTKRTTGNCNIYYNTVNAIFYLTPVGPEDGFPTLSFTMSTDRHACEDQPFDMFAIPADDIEIKDGANTYTGIGSYSKKLAVAIAGAAEGLAGQDDPVDLYALYDIQLLPYCPIPEIVDDGINLTSLTVGEDYDWIDYTGTIEEYHEQSGYPTGSEYEPGSYEAVLDIDTGEASLTNILTYGYDILEGQELVGPDNIVTRMIGGTAHLVYSTQIMSLQDAEEINVRIWWKTQKTDTVHKAIVVYPKTASFRAVLGHELSLRDDMKIEAICNNYRLVAPNYQGSFDFNVAKNRGHCDGFTAYCTYKPYTPYIRVAPQFDWMYGTNFSKEARGLICNGDYSLGRVNSQWAQYQLQNKNYQNIFNREIQNLDVNQSIQRAQQYAAGGIGIINSAVQGGVTGAIAGGGAYGAIAGAAVAGLTSTGGYIADNYLMEKGMIEQRQFALDKFRMNIANIQAIQYTLTKVSSFDIDSAVFPVLEYYTCTDVEKEALKQKIKYEGMTVGIVDTLSKYMFNGYLQADLIRNDEIIDDPHLLEDIYIELTKGVYM